MNLAALITSFFILFPTLWHPAFAKLNERCNVPGRGSAFGICTTRQNCAAAGGKFLPWATNLCDGGPSEVCCFRSKCAQPTATLVSHCMWSRDCYQIQGTRKIGKRVVSAYNIFGFMLGNYRTLSWNLQISWSVRFLYMLCS